MPHRFEGGDYVLGTEDIEIRRLGLQHAVWRARATDAWRRAGFTAGQHLVDVGCGPGYATLDLSDIVGYSGRITAMDRSRRFLDHLSARLSTDPDRTVDLLEVDLDGDALPVLSADGAWLRWVFAFVAHPRELLRKVRGLLRPGASLVIHEYFDYTTWRLIPRDKSFEEFVETVKTSWRTTGGEPDIGLDLLSWLPVEGFRIAEVRPMLDVISANDFMWQWPATFVEVGVARLADLGYITAERAAGVSEAIRRTADDPHGRMITPGVIEIIGVAEDQ